MFYVSYLLCIKNISIEPILQNFSSELLRKYSFIFFFRGELLNVSKILKSWGGDIVQNVNLLLPHPLNKKKLSFVLFVLLWSVQYALNLSQVQKQNILQLEKQKWFLFLFRAAHSAISLLPGGSGDIIHGNVRSERS